MGKQAFLKNVADPAPMGGNADPMLRIGQDHTIYDDPSFVRREQTRDRVDD